MNKEEIIEQITDTIDDVVSFFRSIKDGTTNVIKWLPIIWKDQQWGEHFLYDILHFKLKLMKDFFESDKTHLANAQNNAYRLKICVLLLERLINDDYHEIAFKPHIKKWGRPKLNYGPEDSKGCVEAIFTYKNVKNKEDEQQRCKEYHYYRKAEEALIKQDLEVLSTIIQKHARTWWD